MRKFFCGLLLTVALVACGCADLAFFVVGTMGLGISEFDFPSPYERIMNSWSGKCYSIDELLEYGNFGEPTGVWRCPKECEEAPYSVSRLYELLASKPSAREDEISAIYAWRIFDPKKSPNLLSDADLWSIVDGKMRPPSKDDGKRRTQDVCITVVYVGGSGKCHNNLSNTTVDVKGKIRFVSSGWAKECNRLMKAGVWDPDTYWSGKDRLSR